VAAFRHHDLDDVASGQQAPSGVACRAWQSTSLADLDLHGRCLGIAADELGAVDCLRQKPLEVERRMSELPPVSVYVSRIEEMQTEIERLRNALIVFSDPLSWRRDAICDPNSGNFKGQQIANDALSRS
jgi:hypothetical protein